MAANILKAALIGLALIAPAAGPAAAGGTLQLSVTATGPESRALLGHVLRLYAGSASARVAQTGSGNAAAVAQSGKGQRAVVGQSGSGHAASVTQTGRGNRLGLYQFGTGTSAEVVQAGRGLTQLYILGGW